MEVKKAWCFFEQSGTFRDSFIELGIDSVCQGQRVLLADKMGIIARYSRNIDLAMPH